MGQKLSILAQTTPYIDISSYINIIQDLQFIKNLNNNSKFISTNKCISIDGNDREIISKIFIKPEQLNTSNSSSDNNNDPLNIGQIIRNLEEEGDKLKNINNALHYPHILNLSRATYLFRPFLLQTINDRISPHNNTNNTLELIEIRFMIFQIIQTLLHIHDSGVVHGNITPNNIFLTSMDTIVFTDFSFFLKPFYLPEDNPNEYDFYFGRNASIQNSTANSGTNLLKIKEVNGIKVNIKETSANRNRYSAAKGFYLAPERLDNEKRNTYQPNMLSDAKGVYKEDFTKCDIFSIGCIIFELLATLHSNGSKLFTFQEIFKFKNGDNALLESKLSLLTSLDFFYLELIRDCCKINSIDRLSCSQILQKYKGTFFPNFFYTDMYSDIIENLNDFNNLEFKFYEFCKSFKVKLDNIGFPVLKNENSKVENEVMEDFEFIHFAEDKDLIFLQKYNDLNQEQNECIENKAAIIYINTFGKLLKVLASVKDIMLCLDCLLIMSQYISDDIKFDLVLPYLMSYSTTASDPICNSFALKKIVQLFSIIGEENTDIINDTLCYYVFPVIREAMDSGYLDFNFKTTLISVLPKLLNYTTSNNKTLKKNVVSIVSTLLVEDDIECKILLLKSIPDLLQFIGKTVTTDLILSHLITYLNDPSIRMKIALVNCLTKMAYFLGQISFQEFIYPLLLQNLYLLPDQESLILAVLKNLHILISQDSCFIKNKKFINFKNLMEEHLIHFLLLPNEVLKQAAVDILKTIIIDKSDLSDRYCLFYPIIKPYYHMNMEINQQLLQNNSKNSITKEQFKFLFKWAMKHDSKNSYFWKEKKSSGVAIEHQYNNYMDPDEMNQYLSMEDKLYIDDFVRIYKMDLYHVWKLAKLRKYVKKVINSVSLNLKNDFIEKKSVNSGNAMLLINQNDFINAPTIKDITTIDYTITYNQPGDGKKNLSSKRKDSAKLISQKLLNDALRNVNDSNTNLERVSTQAKNDSGFIDIWKTVFSVEKTINEPADNNVMDYIESISIKPCLDRFNEISYKSEHPDNLTDISLKNVSAIANFEKICDYGDSIQKIVANDKFIAVTTKLTSNKCILLYDVYSFGTLNVANYDQYMKKIDLTAYTQINEVPSQIHEFKFWNDDILIISFDNGVILLLKILDNLEVGVLNKTAILGSSEYGHIIACTADQIFILTSSNRFFEYIYVENKLIFMMTWNSKVLEDTYDKELNDSDLLFEIITGYVVKDNILLFITSANNVYVYDLEFKVLRNLYQLYQPRNMDKEHYFPLSSVYLNGNDALVLTGGYDISVIIMFNFKDLINWDEESELGKSTIVSANKVILNSCYKNFLTDDDIYDKFILKRYDQSKKYTNDMINQQHHSISSCYNFVAESENILAFYDNHSDDVSFIDINKNKGNVLFTNLKKYVGEINYKKYNLNNYLKLYYRTCSNPDYEQFKDYNKNVILTRYIYLDNNTSFLLIVEQNGHMYCYIE